MSSFTPPRIQPAVMLGLITARREAPAPPPSAPNPRVQTFPSADGTVLIVGVTLRGRWVSEYRCLAEDFDDKAVRGMERKVQRKERQWHEVPPLVSI